MAPFKTLPIPHHPALAGVLSPVNDGAKQGRCSPRALRELIPRRHESERLYLVKHHPVELFVSSFVAVEPSIECRPLLTAAIVFSDRSICPFCARQFRPAPPCRLGRSQAWRRCLWRRLFHARRIIRDSLPVTFSKFALRRLGDFDAFRRCRRSAVLQRQIQLTGGNCGFHPYLLGQILARHRTAPHRQHFVQLQR